MADLDTLRKVEWFPVFEQLMRNRIVMGAFRYLPLAQKKNQQYQMFDYLKAKVADYEKTGNTECLVDIANMAALEFLFPSHSNAHWKACDDGQHCQTLS